MGNSSSKRREDADVKATPVAVLHLPDHSHIQVINPTLSSLIHAVTSVIGEPAFSEMALSCGGHIVRTDDDLAHFMLELGVIHRDHEEELNSLGKMTAVSNPTTTKTVSTASSVAKTRSRDEDTPRRILAVEVVAKPPETQEDEDSLVHHRSQSLLGSPDFTAEDDSGTGPEDRLVRQTTSLEDFLSESEEPPQFDVVFVGAGPVGLWTAISLKIESPATSIIMLEKYATYQRRHVVQLNPASMSQRPSKSKHGQAAQDFEALCLSLPYNVRTNELEDKLTGLAIKLGIVVKIETVTSLVDVMTTYRPHVVVGSDGSHSLVRKSMTHGGKPDISMDLTIERTVNLKYEAFESPKQRALTTRELYCLMKLVPSTYCLFEHVGKAAEPVAPSAAAGSGRLVRPVTVVIAGLSTEDFDSVKGATFRNPITLSSRFGELTPSLRAAVKGWFAASTNLVDEEPVPNSETIAPVALRVYRATWFAEIRGYLVKGSDAPVPCAVALVGDAAFGVPYFRALNNGFIAGSNLAHLLSKALKADDKSSRPDAIEAAVNQYHRDMLFLVTGEINRAMMKQSALGTARSVTQFNMKLPQVQKLPDRAAQAVREAVAAETTSSSA